jgi:hypothetical protein
VASCRAIATGVTVRHGNTPSTLPIYVQQPDVESKSPDDCCHEKERLIRCIAAFTRGSRCRSCQEHAELKRGLGCINGTSSQSASL